MPAGLILGFGNPLLSDDGVGCKAATLLKGLLTSPDLTVISAHQLTPEFADPIARCSRVLFLDAAHSGIPGEIRCEKIRRDPHFRPGTLSHHLPPSALLEIASRYFQAEPEAWLLTLTGGCFDLGDGFSPPVASAWNSYLENAKSWISNV